MQQTPTVTPFMAFLASMDHRALRDVGLDGDGNFLDSDDPRLDRRSIHRPLVNRLLDVLSMLETPPRNSART